MIHDAHRHRLVVGGHVDEAETVGEGAPSPRSIPGRRPRSAWAWQGNSALRRSNVSCFLYMTVWGTHAHEAFSPTRVTSLWAARSVHQVEAERIERRLGLNELHGEAADADAHSHRGIGTERRAGGDRSRADVERHGVDA